MDMRIGLILVNTGIGGTERRFANLFNYVRSTSANSYLLALPRRLLRSLCGQRLLSAGQPGVVPLFERWPNSTYNRLPVRLCGRRRMLGLDLALRTFVTREVNSKFAHYGGVDVLHYVLPSAVLSPALPDTPLVIEAVDSTHTHVKAKLVQNGLRGHACFNCLSDSIRQEYQSYLPPGRDPNCVVAAPCSFIDYDKCHIGKKKNAVTFVGRMEQVKNPELFLRSLSLVASRQKGLESFMLGTGGRDGEIDRLIQNMNLERVVTRRFEPHPERILAQSRVFVSLQAHENYPSQALLEAMACGCAVVASDVGETAKLVTDDVGYRVPLDAEAVADRIERLLERPSMAEQMGAAAREKVMREHSIERFARHLERLYEKAVQAYYA